MSQAVTQLPAEQCLLQTSLPVLLAAGGRGGSGRGRSGRWMGRAGRGGAGKGGREKGLNDSLGEGVQCGYSGGKEGVQKGQEGGLKS